MPRMWTPTAAGDVRRSRVAREITMTDQALAQLPAELFTAIRLLSGYPVPDVYPRSTVCPSRSSKPVSARATAE